MMLSIDTCLYFLVLTSVRVCQSELFFRLLRLSVTCALSVPADSFMSMPVGNCLPQKDL